MVNGKPGEPPPPDLAATGSPGKDEIQEHGQLLGKSSIKTTPEKRTDAFNRSKLVGRTPPGQETSSHKKRKGSPLEVSMSKRELIRIFGELMHEIEALHTLSKGSSNVKKEIVRSINRLKDITYLAEGHVDVLPSPQKPASESSQATMVSQGTQTSSTQSEASTQTQSRESEEFRNHIAAATEQVDKVELIQTEWPKETFKNTSLKRKCFLSSDCPVRVVWQALNNTKEEKGILAQFPSLSRADLNRTPISICNSDQLTLADGSTTTLSRKLIVCGVDKEADPENILKTAIDLSLSTEGEEIVEILAPDFNLSITRRSLEIAFWNTNTKIILCTRKPGNEGRVKSMGKEDRGAGSLTVRADGKTFADLAKDLSSNVNWQDVGIEIASMRKTANGDLQLRVRGGSEKASIVARAITSNVEGSSVSSDERKRVLHIKNIPFDATAEEVIAAVHVAAGGQNTEALLTNLRPAYGGAQNATVKIDKSGADKIISIGKIKIGFISCVVEERKSDRRCYKCWNVGHRPTDCKGPAKSKTCFNCQQEGHLKRDCPELKSEHRLSHPYPTRTTDGTQTQ